MYDKALHKLYISYPDMIHRYIVIQRCIFDHYRMDVSYLDLYKAFDTIYHSKLLQKLSSTGMGFVTISICGSKTICLKEPKIPTSRVIC